MVVHDDDAKLDAFLAQHRPQCLFKVFLFIPSRDDNTEFRPVAFYPAFVEWPYGTCACDSYFEQDEHADRKHRDECGKEEQRLHCFYGTSFADRIRALRLTRRMSLRGLCASVPPRGYYRLFGDRARVESGFQAVHDRVQTELLAHY